MAVIFFWRPVTWLSYALVRIACPKVSAGTGADFLTYKFNRIQEEEKDRSVIGMSAKGMCNLLAELAKQCQLADIVARCCLEATLCYSHTHVFTCDLWSCVALDHSHPTEASKLHGKSWNQETVDRYVKVATKLSSLPKTCVALDLMEAHLGRESCLDGITVLRSLASLLA